MTQDLDITLSENLTGKKSWQEWIRENILFLIVLGGLSLVSIVLMVYNQWEVRVQQRHIQTLLLQQKPEMSRNEKPKVKKTKDPLAFSEQLYSTGKIDESISELLKISKEAPNEALRQRASLLVKKFHRIKKRQEKRRKLYLEGYVLFHTYPKEACKRWRDIVQTQHEDDIPDEYFQKGLTRWQQDCQG